MGPSWLLLVCVQDGVGDCVYFLPLKPRCGDEVKMLIIMGRTKAKYVITNLSTRAQGVLSKYLPAFAPSPYLVYNATRAYTISSYRLSEPRLASRMIACVVHGQGRGENEAGVGESNPG